VSGSALTAVSRNAETYAINKFRRIISNIPVSETSVGTTPMANETPEETPVEPNSETPAEPIEAASTDAADAVASEPAEETAAPEAPVVAEEPIVADEPVVAEEPVAAEEPSSPTEAVAEQADDAAAADGEPELTFSSAVATSGEEAPSMATVIRGKIDKFGVAMGTGRRKTSVARVRIQRGDGKLTVNGRNVEDYCRLERDRIDIEAPLRATDTFGKVDVWVRVQGGGTTGQAGAVVLGIARALQAMDASLHSKLSEGGFLTRDSRMVERKKYGYKKARKSFQFSKR
jgi:small subunit ribosomal protein S9